MKGKYFIFFVGIIFTITQVVGVSQLTAGGKNKKTSARQELDSAVLIYDKKQYKEAENILTSLIANHPSSKYVDNALVYLAKVHKKLKLFDLAINDLNKLIKNYPESNKIRVAYYLLGKTYYSEKKQYQLVVNLLEPIRVVNDFKSYDLKYLKLLAKSNYKIALSLEKKNQMDNSIKSYDKAIQYMEILVANPKDDEELIDNSISLSKYYYHLMWVEKENEYEGGGEGNRTKASIVIDDTLQMDVDEDQKSKLLKLKKKIRKSKTYIRSEIEVDGVYNTLGAFGLDGNLNLSIRMPKTRNARNEINIKYIHDGFSLTTFYFPTAEVNDFDARLIQRTDKINLEIGAVRGLLGKVKSTFKFNLGYMFAEDKQLSAAFLGLSENVRIKLAEKLKLNVKTALTGAYHPSYQLTRRIDNAKFKVNPNVTWQLLDFLSLKLGYDFGFKYYMNAKYHELNGSTVVPASKSKKYLIHKFGVSSILDIKEFLQIGFKYNLVLHRVKNYDKSISGRDSAGARVKRFINDYYAYNGNTFGIAANANIGKRIQIQGQTDITFKSFLNYIPRDKNKVFKNDFRLDKIFKISGQITYLFLSAEDNQKLYLGIRLNAEYRKNNSNMEYENSFSTNYQYFQISLGPVLKLP